MTRRTKLNPLLQIVQDAGVKLQIAHAAGVEHQFADAAQKFNVIIFEIEKLLKSIDKNIKNKTFYQAEHELLIVSVLMNELKISRGRASGRGTQQKDKALRREVIQAHFEKYRTGRTRKLRGAVSIAGEIIDDVNAELKKLGLRKIGETTLRTEIGRLLKSAQP